MPTFVMSNKIFNPSKLKEYERYIYLHREVRYSSETG